MPCTTRAIAVHTCYACRITFLVKVEEPVGSEIDDELSQEEVVEHHFQRVEYLAICESKELTCVHQRPSLAHQRLSITDCASPLAHHRLLDSLCMSTSTSRSRSTST